MKLPRKNNLSLETKAYMISYNKKNRAKLSKQQLVKYHERRALSYKILGDKCCKCGYDKWPALQIDHKTDQIGRHDPRRKAAAFKLHKFIREHPEEAKKEFQLLCANCNWLKRWEERESGTVKYDR
jgi:hypothetical protein